MREQIEKTIWCEHGNTNHVYCADCTVKSQQQLVDSQANQLEIAIKALEDINKEYMRYVENEIECDTAAVKMDGIAEIALSSINRLSGGNET